VYRVLVGKPEGKRPLRRPRRRREDGIRIDIREISWGDRVDPAGSEYGSMAVNCNYHHERTDSGPTELVSYSIKLFQRNTCTVNCAIHFGFPLSNNPRDPFTRSFN
jgi:hypothetical protein